MSVSFAAVSLKAPPGIDELLSDFAREVLRSQPTDINAFGAEYFGTLLKRREAGGEGMELMCFPVSFLLVLFFPPSLSLPPFRRESFMHHRLYRS